MYSSFFIPIAVKKQRRGSMNFYQVDKGPLKA